MSNTHNPRVIHNYLTHCQTNPQPPGFGDFLRGTAALFELSQTYQYDLFLDNSHPIFRYLSSDKIIQNDLITETVEYLPPLSYKEIYEQLDSLFQKNEDFTVMTNSFYCHGVTESRETFFNGVLSYYFTPPDMSEECKTYLKNALSPTEELNQMISDAYQKMGIDVNKPYSVVHLRCGDGYIYDSNQNNEELVHFVCYKLNHQIQQNTPDMQYVLLTDSSAIGLEIKKRIPHLFYFENKKIHLGGLQQIENGVSDTLVDFFIITKCKKVHYLNNSGFSRYVCKIYDIDWVPL